MSEYQDDITIEKIPLYEILDKITDTLSKFYDLEDALKGVNQKEKEQVFTEFKNKGEDLREKIKKALRESNNGKTFDLNSDSKIPEALKRTEKTLMVLKKDDTHESFNLSQNSQIIEELKILKDLLGDLRTAKPIR
jgi:5S rRNA maturation endonuclease (ribonuclease M5)